MKRIAIILIAHLSFLSTTYAQNFFVFDGIKKTGFNDELTAVQSNGEWGFLHKSGKLMVTSIYDEVQEFSEGLAWVKNNGKWGVINTQGEEVIPFKYERGFSFQEGFARAVLNGKVGFIDKKGNPITDFIYSSFGTQDFSEGFAPVGVATPNLRMGLIDTNGALVVPLQNKAYSSFSEGLCWYQDLDDKSKKLISKDQSIINTANYGFTDKFSEGLARVTKGDLDEERVGYINKQGKEVIPLKYESGRDFSNGLASVELNGKYGVIDKTGKIVIPFEYDGNLYFNEQGISSAAKDYYYGYIDKQGEEIIPFKYEKAESFKEGFARVEKDNEAFFINIKGEKVISLSEYDDAGKYFSEGLLPVQKNGKWGFIDKNGKPLEIKE